MAFNSYDEEAKLLLAEAADLQRRDAVGREQAATAVVIDLLKLNGTAGFQVQQVDDTSVHLVFPETNKKAVVGVGPQGVILVGPDKSDLKEVSLWFNRLTGRLESSEDDDFYVPVPGEPKRRKTALATVVKHALSAIK